MSSRRAIIDPDLLAAARRGPCLWCGRPGRCQAAHIVTKGAGGWANLEIPENICSLCIFCHSAQHNTGRPTAEELREKLAEKLGTTAAKIKEKTDQLLWRRQ